MMKYGFNQICINPQGSMLPTGFFTQIKPVSQVRGDLYARILHIEDDNKNLIMITLDSLGVSSTVYRKIEALVKNLTDSSCELTVSCSHTHFAPSLSLAMGMFFPNEEYTEFVLDRLSNCLRNLKLSDAVISVDYNRENFSVVGRSRLSTGNDDNVEAGVLSFYNNSHRIGNFLYYNCHPTVSPEDAAYFSSDYVGLCIEQLHQRYPNEFFMFMQGAAGDISTRFTRQTKSYEEVIRLGRSMAAEFNQLLELNVPKFPLEHFTVSSTPIILHHSVKEVTVPVNQTISEKEKRELTTAVALSEQMRKNIGYFEKVAVMTRVDFGPYHMMFNPFELFSSYLNYTHRDNTLVIGYSQGYIGYVSKPENNEITYETLMETVSETDKKSIVSFLTSAL